MTSFTASTTGRTQAGRDAADAADAAAARSGVVVRELVSADDAAAASALLAAVWSSDGGGAGVVPPLIRALAHSGNCGLGAYDGERIVGAAVAFLGRGETGVELHSHVLGVDPAGQRRSIGYALKLRQRAWALARDIDVIRWTTDPLVRGNASFNVMKLGARVVSYEVDFYGRSDDAINAGDDTDRVTLAWHLRSAAAQRACSGRPARLDADALCAAGAAIALAAGEDGEPRVADAAGDGRPTLLFVPEDVVSMRAVDPARGRRWRRALRAALSGELAAGRRVTGFTLQGHYLLEGRR